MLCLKITEYVQKRTYIDTTQEVENELGSKDDTKK